MDSPMTVVREAATAEELQQDKYDRQKRLWGEGGQARLAQAHVCLLGATAAGAETLKNLVLGGIKAFTVIDGDVVSQRDLGTNFFVRSDRVGDKRARVVTDLLVELNPDVSGEFIVERPQDTIERNAAIFRSFDLVIASSLRRGSLRTLSRVCNEQHMPLITINTNGLVAMLRLDFGEHVVIETKPDNTILDLRITKPFPELQQFLEELVPSQKYPSLSHGHVPYVAVLYHTLKEWIAEKGRMPSTYPEKKEFKAAVQSLDPSANLLNIEEAVSAVNTLFSSTRVPDRIASLLTRAKHLNVDEKLSSFWIIMKAVADFVASEEVLPLPGSLPDMEADTATFLALQRIYKDKAERDIAAVIERVRHLMSQARVTEKMITEDEISRVCKNIYSLDVLQYKPLGEQEGPSESLATQFAIDAESDALWFVLFCAAELFAEKHAHLPGDCDSKDNVDIDAQMFKSDVAATLTSVGLDSSTIDEKFVLEFCRYGNSEIHSIAAIIGGVAAQEGIKVLTRQLVTLNSVFVFNGVRGTGTQFSL